MKSIERMLLIFLIVINLSSCRNSDEIIYTPDIPAEAYTYIISEKTEIINLLDDSGIEGNVDICYPCYIFDLRADLSIQQKSLFPCEYITFPVLESKELIGFLIYPVSNGEHGEPKYRSVSSETAEKIKNKHTIRIAFAEWEIDDDSADYCCYDISVADDNSVSFLFDEQTGLSLPNIKYKDVKGLSEINIDTLLPIESVIVPQN